MIVTHNRFQRFTTERIPTLGQMIRSVALPIKRADIGLDGLNVRLSTESGVVDLPMGTCFQLLMLGSLGVPLGSG